MVETIIDEVSKNLDNTIKDPAEAIACLESALDTDRDGKITKEEFLENGAEAIFAKLLEGLATLENVGEMMMMMMMITSITNTM
eukprot:COSAG06_NODE_1142_length_10545_cov_2.879571_2_plen_84_part_00